MASVKLDEHVPDSVGRFFGPPVTMWPLARDQQLAGVPDERLLATAAAEGRVLISFDRGFANVIQHPPDKTAGIVVIRLGEQTLPRIRQVARTLAALLAEQRIDQRLWVLAESRLRIWPRGPG